MNLEKTILVVDDEQRNRNLMQAMLKSLGYKSILAANATEALARINEQCDLLLLDVMMPGIDGFELARKVRDHPGFGDVPIIMVTVLTNKQDRLAAVEAGANDFITKPIDKLELKVRMASLLKMKEAQDEIKRHRAELEATVHMRTAALRESEGRFRAIFEAAQDCIFVQDTSFRHTQVNPAMAKLLGRSEENILGLTDEMLFGEEAGNRDREVATRVLSGETVEEERTRLVNGAPATFLELRVPIRDDSGRITGLCGIFRNVTDRKTLQTPHRLAVPEHFLSEAMLRTLDKALLVASSDSTVLLTGESGSGKDYLARFVHDHSKRANGPFFTINCAAISSELAESELFGHESGAFTGATRKKRGLLELAEGGTLLLNEIGELSLPLQAKLLTFLDTRTFSRVGGEKTVCVSARLMAATNRNLQAEVTSGRFRADLFYRLNVYSVVVPPLRHRSEDIPVLTQQIVAELASEMQLDGIPSLDSSTMNKLRRYDWPGNIRELRNVLERSLIVARGGPVTIDLGIGDGRENVSPLSDWSWTGRFPLDKSLTDTAADLKRCLIQHALDASNGKRIDAARLLNTTRDSLKRQMKTLGFYSAERESEF